MPRRESAALMTDADAFLGTPLMIAAGQPIRVAVYSRLADGIRSGVFPLGALLPRETELAEQLRVSRTPVREALILLEEDGLIRTRRGVGRFVSDALPHTGLEVFRPFDELLAQNGASITVRTLRFELNQTTDFVSNKLTLDAAANTWFHESIVERDGEPVAIVQEHLPAGRYLADLNPDVDAALEEAAHSSRTLLGALIDRVGPVFEAGMCEVTASIAGESRGPLLEIDNNDPVLILVQTAEHHGTPIYLAKCIVSSQVSHLSIVQSAALPS